MKRLDSFIDFAKEHIDASQFSKTQQIALIDREKKELTRKINQIDTEIETELIDFYDYLHLKEANIRTLLGIRYELDKKMVEKKEQILKLEEGAEK